MCSGKAVLVAISALSLLGLGGCSQTQRYMATGAALGIGGGAIVAAATGGAVVGGAIVGGALGTGTAYVIAK